MIILRLLLLLTNLHLKLLSTQGTGADKLLSTQRVNNIALCLGGHIKVRVPGATITRKNTCVIITPQYYAPSGPS